MAKTQEWRVYITCHGSTYLYRVRARSARGAEGLARARYWWWFPERKTSPRKGIESINALPMDHPPTLRVVA